MARSTQRHLKVIDAGPYGSGELRRLFQRLPAEQLTRCWVACFADTLLTELRPDDGDMAPLIRALIVVAERLHGCQFDTPIHAQLSEQGATDMHEDERTPPEAAESTKATNKSTQGFEIREETPPPPKKATRGHDPLRDAILALNPGQHIHIAKGAVRKQTLYSKITNLKKNHGLDKRVTSYEAANGDLIVVFGEKIDPALRSSASLRSTRK